MKILIVDEEEDYRVLQGRASSQSYAKEKIKS
jgi:hypothetical protein